MELTPGPMSPAALEQAKRACRHMHTVILLEADRVGEERRRILLRRAVELAEALEALNAAEVTRSHGPFDLGGALYPGPLSVVNMTGRTQPVVTSDVVDRTADQLFPPPAEEAPTVTRTVPFVDWLLVAGIVTAGLASVAIAELRHRYHRRNPR